MNQQTFNLKFDSILNRNITFTQEKKGRGVRNIILQCTKDN